MEDLSFIKQNASNKLVKQKSVKLENIKKLTHIFMHYKNIQNIGNLRACENLQVLYLNNNAITKIINLETLTTLKHLYLNNNKITKIEGLDKLENLEKLHLGCNEISVVEGLEKMPNLFELQIQNQRLSKGEILCFDPRTILALANSLQILNISQNNLVSLIEIRFLKNLRVLDASCNNLSNVNDVGNILCNWFYLRELDFNGNPMAKMHRYRDKIISSTFKLDTLDKKPINEITREFIKRFEIKQSQHKLNSFDKRKFGPPKSFPGKIPPPLEQTISKTFMKKSSDDILLTTLESLSDTEVYIPWNALRTTVSDSGKVVPPLLVKQERQKRPGKKKVQFATIFPQFA